MLKVSDRMAAFLAKDLLPLIAGSWPASAGQLDSNMLGVAKAWGAILGGFTKAQIMDAVLEMTCDVSRQFAPRPAEVRAAILQRAPVTQMVPAGAEISIRACEMRAEVAVRQRDGALSDAAMRVELDRVLAGLRQQGVTITGRVL